MREELTATPPLLRPAAGRGRALANIAAGPGPSGEVRQRFHQVGALEVLNRLLSSALCKEHAGVAAAAQRATLCVTGLLSEATAG